MHASKVCNGDWSDPAGGGGNLSIPSLWLSAAPEGICEKVTFALATLPGQLVPYSWKIPSLHTPHGIHLRLLH